MAAHRVFAVVTLDAQGTVHLRLMSEEGDAWRTHERLAFDKSHPEYARVLGDVGPLRAGEEKIVRPSNKEPS